MMDRNSLRKWQEMYKNGEFSASDGETQVKAGWYDWYCRESSLVNKTHRLAKPIMELADSNRLNLDKMYVWFKNNWPINYPLYDNFRISDIETGEVLYVVSLREPWDEENHLWNVSALCEDLVLTGDGFLTTKSYPFKKTKELVEWFNEKTGE